MCFTILLSSSAPIREAPKETHDYAPKGQAGKPDWWRAGEDSAILTHKRQGSSKRKKKEKTSPERSELSLILLSILQIKHRVTN